MKKSDIIDHVVDETNLTRSQATAAVESVFAAVSGSLKRNESVFVRGFATIKVVTTKPRKGFIFHKGTHCEVPEQKSAKILICRELKAKMNG